MDSIQFTLPPSESLLDHNQLKSFITIGYADYTELLSDAIQDVAIHLTAIQAAIQQGKWSELRDHSHSLRGMLSYFGCIAMTARLKTLEESTALTPPQAAAIHGELQILWSRSLAAIRHWEKSIPNFAASC